MDEQITRAELAKSRSLGANGANGADGKAKENRSSGYIARVESARRPSRAEVESMLASTSESIVDRVEALRQEITGTGKGITRAIRENAWIGVGTALVGGAISGYLLTPSRRKRRASRDGSAELASAVTRTVQSSLDEGADPTPSVAALLSRAGTAEAPKPRKRHPFAEAVGLAVLNLAIKEVSKRLSKDPE
jgi:hypothetical protein